MPTPTPDPRPSVAPGSANELSATWLGLLIREGEAADFTEHRQRLLSDDSADKSLVDSWFDQAMQLRSQQALRKQNADELTVLNDLARRLATLRDPAEVLQEVATQARRLLGMDVAYIMLLRDDSHLHIEVVDGSMGSALRGIKLEIGRGLGGQVLLTGQPMWSESYLDDTRFVHVGSVDTAAVSEQLGGILGVPLIVAEETIGVLLAADRHPRTFVSREVQLLAALAAHAAVAIRNATLFDENRRVTQELRSANQRLEETIASRQRGLDLRDALTSSVISGESVSALLEMLSEALGTRVHYYADREPEPKLAPLRDLVGVERGVDMFPPDGPATWKQASDVGHVMAARVALRTGYVGCLVAVQQDPFDEDAHRYLTNGATAVALVVASERSVTEAELRIRGEFVNALLSPSAEEASVRRRARATGVEIDEITAVVVIDPGDEDPLPALRSAGRLIGRFRDEAGGWSAEHDNRLVLFLPRIDVAQVSGRLTELNLPGAGGISATEGGVQSLRGAYETARQTATILHALGRPRDCLQSSELGVYRSLFSEAGRNEILSFVGITVGPVLEHDQEKQRDLTITLRTYLRLAQHHAKTCAQLHIHANTLYQRLDRVTQLLGESWREPDRMLEIQLALKMHELLGELHAQHVPAP